MLSFTVSTEACNDYTGTAGMPATNKNPGRNFRVVRRDQRRITAFLTAKNRFRPVVRRWALHATDTKKAVSSCSLQSVATAYETRAIWKDYFRAALNPIPA